jgi:hypothetical protein
MNPHDRVLTAAEFAQLLERARGETEEIQQQRELIRWFRARYPTAGDRLRYARRRHAEWMRSKRS